MRAGTRRSPAATKPTTTTPDRRGARPQRSASYRSWRALAVVVGCLGCAKAQAPHAPARERTPLHRGPLTDYVPAAGLHWLVQAKPRALLENPVTSRAIAGLVPRAGMDGFATASGVDLRQVTQALIAGFDYSTVYLVDLPPGSAANARARFTERLVAGAIDKEPYPGVRRVSGVVGQTPETLLTLDDALLVVTVGDPTPSRIAEAFARERLKTSPSALHGSALRELPDLTSNNLLVALAPGPFPEDWQRAGNGLLASSVAVAAAIRPVEPASLGVTLVLMGDFSPGPDTAALALGRAWQALAQSSTGRLLGLDQASEPRISAAPQKLQLELELPVDPLVHGLRAAVLADVSEILRLSPRPERKAEPAPSP